MSIQTGDILASGPGPAAVPSLFQRAILATGANHTHDEVCVWINERLYVGNAHWPRFELVPWEVRKAEYFCGQRSMRVLRWGEFRSQESEVRRKEFQQGMVLLMRMLGELGPRYDWQAIACHAARYLFGKWVKTWQVENRVYCTEDVFMLFDVLGIDLNNYCGRQPLPSPVHVDRLERDGWLVRVE